MLSFYQTGVGVILILWKQWRKIAAAHDKKLCLQTVIVWHLTYEVAALSHAPKTPLRQELCAYVMRHNRRDRKLNTVKLDIKIGKNEACRASQHLQLLRWAKHLWCMTRSALCPKTNSVTANDHTEFLSAVNKNYRSYRGEEQQQLRTLESWNNTACSGEFHFLLSLSGCVTRHIRHAESKRCSLVVVWWRWLHLTEPLYNDYLNAAGHLTGPLSQQCHHLPSIFFNRIIQHVSRRSNYPGRTFRSHSILNLKLLGLCT